MVVAARGKGHSPAGLGTGTCLGDLPLPGSQEGLLEEAVCWPVLGVGKAGQAVCPGPRRLGVGARLFRFVPWRGPRLGLFI